MQLTISVYCKQEALQSITFLLNAGKTTSIKQAEKYKMTVILPSSKDF